MPPKISVIIPAYNEEKYIRQTLHSLKNQTFQDYEIIIVANGCTDKTEEIIKKRLSDRLNLFSLPQAHVSRARNYGAENAKGEIFLFLDADTILEINSLQEINSTFKNGFTVATTKVKPDNSQFKYKAAMLIKNWYNQTGLYKGCSGALICRRDDFFKVDGYDKNLIVKEHKKLTDKLSVIGKYTVVNTYVTTSMRRLENWGILKSSLFWMQKWFEDKIGDLRKSKYEEVR